jgi:putative transcriptional regulator
MISHHVDDEMLLAYSAGSLAEGWSIGVASHLSLCPHCRKRYALLENLGGYLLENEYAISEKSGDWEQLKERVLSTPQENSTAQRQAANDSMLPAPLLRYVENAGGLKWKNYGSAVAQMVIPTNDRSTTVRLLKIRAGQPVPEHTHGGTEFTMVLQGTFSDEVSSFGRGDVEVSDGAVMHTPVAHAGEDCICLAVTDKPLKFKSRLMRLIQPLFGI